MLLSMHKLHKSIYLEGLNISEQGWKGACSMPKSYPSRGSLLPTPLETWLPAIRYRDVRHQIRSCHMFSASKKCSIRVSLCLFCLSVVPSAETGKRLWRPPPSQDSCQDATIAGVISIPGPSAHVFCVEECVRNKLMVPNAVIHVQNITSFPH